MCRRLEHRLDALAAVVLELETTPATVGASDLFADCRECVICHEPMFPGDPLCPSLLAHESCSLAEFNDYLENPDKYEDGCQEDYARDFPSVSRWTEAELAASAAWDHGPDEAF